MAAERSLFTHHRVASVGTYHQLAANADRPFRRVRQHAADLAAIVQQLVHLRGLDQCEFGKGGGLFCQKVEKLPLRHKGDKFAAGWQACEVCQPNVTPGDLGMQRFRTLVWQSQQCFQQAKLVHDFQRRG